MRLDLGGYKNGKHGYLALNIKDSLNPDIAADITKLPFKNNSIESIYTRRTI